LGGKKGKTRTLYLRNENRRNPGGGGACKKYRGWLQFKKKRTLTRGSEGIPKGENMKNG